MTSFVTGFPIVSCISEHAVAQVSRKSCPGRQWAHLRGSTNAEDSCRSPALEVFAVSANIPKTESSIETEAINL